MIAEMLFMLLSIYNGLQKTGEYEVYQLIKFLLIDSWACTKINSVDILSFEVAFASLPNTIVVNDKVYTVIELYISQYSTMQLLLGNCTNEICCYILNTHQELCESILRQSLKTALCQT